MGPAAKVRGGNYWAEWYSHHVKKTSNQYIIVDEAGREQGNKVLLYYDLKESGNVTMIIMVVCDGKFIFRAIQLRISWQL